MVYRVFVEKKPALAGEARALLSDLRTLLGMEGLSGLRLFNRYDVENIDADLFAYAKQVVFSEPQLDIVYDELPAVEGAKVFAVEYLPGQFDQRADSAAQCIQILSQGERPDVHSAKVYIVEGTVSDEDLARIKHYVINPVESREADLEEKETLQQVYETPDSVETLTGFTSMDDAAVAEFVKKYGLAMDADDLAFCRAYFQSE
ncbi:MAG: phosphoribosylformylglycinamidine synthase, partial [Clostridia bacterium]|nr:phosphoribosylformylglycinamidine synthase [Clostridia bacterium]